MQVKRFKALINSGAALLLVCTSIYNMIEDHYKTKTLPAAIHLKTANGSAMSSLGKATLNLQIANFKFSHTSSYLQATRHRYFIWHRHTEDILSTILLGCGQTIIHTDGRIIFNIQQEQ